MLSTDIKAGQTIATIADRGIVNLGNYNLVISAGRFDNVKGYAVSANETLEELFPSAFKQPAIRVQNLGQPIAYFSGNVYIDKK